MFALRYAVDAGSMPSCWNASFEICEDRGVSLLSERKAVCELSPVEASPSVECVTPTIKNKVKASSLMSVSGASSVSNQAEVTADKVLRTLVKPSKPVPIKSSSMSVLTGLRTPDLPRRLLFKSSAPLAIKPAPSRARSASPVSVPIGVSPRRPAREPLWSEAEMARFWAVIEPYIQQLISGEAPMPAHDMDLWDCDRDSAENIEGCLLAVQDLICGGNYSKALAGIRTMRQYFDLPENLSKKTFTLLKEKDELEVFKQLFMKQDPVRKRLLDDSQRPHSF